MSVERLSEQYYTAAEARKVLGVNENTFQTWVKTKKIRRTKIPGLGQGMYLKRDIDRKAHLIESAMFFDVSKDLEFRNASELDVDAEINLAHLIYGKKVLRPEARRARKQLVETNPESTWLLYDRDILAASLNITPITHEAVERFKQGERGWLFVPDQIRQLESGVPLECVIIDFMTTPTVPPEKRRFYAESLLSELAHTTFKDWGARGVIITTLYTCGSTNDGRALLRNHEDIFEELGEPVLGRVIFRSDIEHLDHRFIRPYKEALAAWKEQST